MDILVCNGEISGSLLYKFRVCDLQEILDMYGVDLHQNVSQDTILWQCIADVQLKASLDKAYKEPVQ